MDKFTKKKYFVGIDISKDHLDVALLRAEELDVFKYKQVENNFKGFAIDISRNSQSPFALFRGQKEHRDETVRNAQEYIERHVGERITVDLLADRLAVGRRSFERRFRQATGNSVLEYIHRVKMEAAKYSLETNRKTIIEVMFDVGYRDLKAFRTTFRKITGLSPVEYRNQYNRYPMVSE